MSTYAANLGARGRGETTGTVPPPPLGWVGGGDVNPCLALLAPHVQPQSRVLIIGCGSSQLGVRWGATGGLSYVAPLSAFGPNDSSNRLFCLTPQKSTRKPHGDFIKNPRENSKQIEKNSGFLEMGI